MQDAQASPGRRCDAAGRATSRAGLVAALVAVAVAVGCAVSGGPPAHAAPAALPTPAAPAALPAPAAPAVLPDPAVTPTSPADDRTTLDVVAVRVSGHAGWTRFVLELSRSVPFRIEPGSNPSQVRLHLPKLNQTDDGTAHNGQGLIRVYRTEPDGPTGSMEILDATAPIRIKSAFLIPPSTGHRARLVVDVVKDAAPANPAPASAATPTADAAPAPAAGPAAKRLAHRPVDPRDAARLVAPADGEPVITPMTAITPTRSARLLLDAALAQAVGSNPTLGAARANLRATEEGLTGARAQARPDAALTATTGLALSKGGIAGTNQPSSVASGTSADWVRTHPRSVGVSVSQPLYKGGQIDAGISQARNTLSAQQASLADAEQTVLLQTATSWLDVAADQAVLVLLTEFETFQKRDLRALQDRYRAGEVTASDVSLQEAQVASASASRVSGKGSLESDAATYTRLVGEPPTRFSLPLLDYPLPATLDEAVGQAETDNPKIIIAKFAEASARDAVDLATGALRPNLSLVGSVSRNLDRSVPNDFSNDATIGANLTIPLDNGTNAAKVRAARESVNTALLSAEQASRVARESATIAWNVLMNARTNITFYENAVKANELAAKGIRQLIAIGAATIIDLLGTEQALLNARINLIRAHHDEAVGTFSVLAATGRLRPETLGLARADQEQTARDQ